MTHRLSSHHPRALAATTALAATVAFVALSSAAPRAEVARSAIRPAPRVQPTETDILAVSADRRTAIVRVRNPRERGVLPRYRSIEIASQRVITEWTLGARDGLEANVFFGRTRRDAVAALAEAPAHRADIERQSTALANASTNNDSRFAVGAAQTAFNIGDDLWVSQRNGSGARRVSNNPAAYGPAISPDGQRVAFTAMVGRLDNVVGNYVLHLLDLRGNALPVAASGTRDVNHEDIAWSATGEHVFARTGSEHPEGGCLVRVGARRPYHVERIACVDRSERIDLVAYSPGRRWAVVRGVRVLPSGGAQQSLQWVNMRTGRVTHTARYQGNGSSGAVNDAGVYLVQSNGQRATRLEPNSQSASVSAEDIPVPIAFFNAAWLDDNRYVVGNDGNVRVIDLQQVRWTPAPWPRL